MSHPFEKPSLSTDFYKGFGTFANADTMETHHTKHHEAYVQKLNAALAPHEAFQGLSIGDVLWNIEAVPAGIRQDVINHGGGHANHTLFWHTLRQGGNGGVTPGSSSGLGKAITRAYGGFDAFKKIFSSVSANLFGSGWAWIAVPAGSETLRVIPAPNQNSPILDGCWPILGLDLWEHAYYLTHKNKRPDYIAEFWNYVDWDRVSALYDGCAGVSRPKSHPLL